MRSARTTARIILISALLAVGSTATARIGESRAESDKRYGLPAQRSSGPEFSAEFGPADSSATYIMGNLQVEAFFWRGRTCRIRYTKVSVSPLEQAEVSQLLKSEAGAGSFLPTNADFASRFYNYESAWRRSDGRILVGKFVLFMDYYDSDYFREWNKPKGLPGNL